MPVLGPRCWVRLGTTRGSCWTMPGNQGLLIGVMVIGYVTAFLWALPDIVFTRQLTL